MSEHEWLDHAAPYALGALEESERTAFEAHLRGCDTCQHEVREMSAVAGLLAFASPAVELPRALRDRVLSDARAARPIAARSPAAAPAPHPAALALGTHRAPGGRLTLVAWLAAAAAIVVAIVLGARFRAESASRTGALAAADSLRGQLATRDSLIATLLAPEVETVPMAAVGQPPSARIYLNRRNNTMVLAAFSLRSAPAGRTYQMWAIERDKPPVSLGTFNTDGAGTARVRLEVPPGVNVEVSAITEEPAGGSPQPTTTPFLVASWSATR